MNARITLTAKDAGLRPITDAATAYNDAGDAYLRYADGNAKQLYTFDGHYSYCDRRLWDLLDSLLVSRRRSGASSITILDAGCGPGTWLRRVVGRARALGFVKITARGFDVAEQQVRRARELSTELADAAGVRLTFHVGDLCQRLPEENDSIDLCMCLYGVLNHLPVEGMARALGELSRVTRGALIATVRAAGSTPTIFVGPLEAAREFRQDNFADRCRVHLKNGQQLNVPFHLFTAAELRKLIEPHLVVADLQGLDLFHSRFAPDERWNPPSAEADGEFMRGLTHLEAQYARNPHFMDRAAHLAVVATKARAAANPDPARP